MTDAGHDPESIRYIWFDRDTLSEICARGEDAGPDARLVIHGPFNQHATVDVEDPAQDAAARLRPLNEAHPCPPEC